MTGLEKWKKDKINDIKLWINKYKLEIKRIEGLDMNDINDIVENESLHECEYCKYKKDHPYCWCWCEEGVREYLEQEVQE